MYIPYILLLLYVGCTRIACYYIEQLNHKNMNKQFVFFSFAGIYLFAALRAFTVGYDYPAYFQVYNSIKGMSVPTVYSINFENGYLAVMKICSDLGMSFYGFAAVVYIIIMVPIAIYIYQQSNDPFMSVMVYICYMFFEFDLTGVRQAMSISMCLLGYLVIRKKPKHWVLWYYTLIIVGITFHRGAYVALIVPLFLIVKDIRISAIISLLMSVFALTFRRFFLSFIKDLFGKGSMNPDAELYFGANLLFLCVFAIVFVYFAFIQQRNSTKIDTDPKMWYGNSYTMETKIYLLSIVVLLFFGMDNSGRAYMNLNKVIISLLPNSLSYIEPRVVVRAIMLLFLVVFFFSNSLIPNGFRLVPYKLFWSVS